MANLYNGTNGTPIICAPYPIKTPPHRLQGQHPIPAHCGAAALGAVPAFVIINITVDDEAAA